MIILELKILRSCTASLILTQELRAGVAQHPGVAYDTTVYTVQYLCGREDWGYTEQNKERGASLPVISLEPMSTPTGPLRAGKDTTMLSVNFWIQL